jgi:hypothetical protein
MTRIKTLIVLTLATTACGQARNQATSAAAPPTKLGDAIRQAQQNSRGPRPAQTGQVAVLELEVSGGAAAAPAPGATAARPAQPRITARVTSSRVVSAAAPRLSANTAGEWEVRLLGRAPLSYRIANPLADIEIENPPGGRSPFSQVVPTGPVPVQIVVPLTRDGRSLGVESIEIVDTASGQTIVTVPLAATPPPR